MHVVLGVERHVVVDDAGQLGDVQAARGDVGGDQHFDLVALERVERGQAFGLRLVAVHRLRAQPVTRQQPRQPAGAEAAVDEDDGLAQLVVAQQLQQRGVLAVFADLVDQLLDVARGGVRSRDLDQHRILQIALRQTLDFGRESGREQQRGALLRQVGEDALQVGQEADVEHAVGFVEHDVLRLRQRDVLGLDVIEQPPWGRDQHFDALAQHRGLRRHVDAAEHARAAQRRVAGVGLHVVEHLVGELAGRRQYQGTHRVARRRHAGAGQRQQLLQDRQRERRGLAGSGLRRAHHVAARQHDRNRALLDRGQRGVTDIGHRAQQPLVEFELGIALRGFLGFTVHRSVRSRSVRIMRAAGVNGCLRSCASAN